MKTESMKKYYKTDEDQAKDAVFYCYDTETKKYIFLGYNHLAVNSCPIDAFEGDIEITLEEFEAEYDVRMGRYMAEVNTITNFKIK
jgi:hypothetical protein